jgi:pilus assembly protein CpaB
MIELRRRLHRLHRFVARRRRPLAGALAGVAVLVSLHTLAPPPTDTLPVVSARRDIAAGTTVSADDVHVVELPVSAAPATAIRDAGHVIGRSTAGPIAAGELVTATRLVGSSLVSGLGPGLVAAPVRLGDAEAVRLLRVGDRIDVYAPSAHGSRAAVVVSSAPVVTLPAGSDQDFGVGGTRPGGALVVLALPPEDAVEVAQEVSRSPLSFALVT